MKLEYMKEITENLDKWHSKDFHIRNIKINFIKVDGIYDIYDVEYFLLNKNPGLSGSWKSTFKFLNNQLEGSMLSAEL